MAGNLYKPTFNYGGISAPDITSGAKLILGGLQVPNEMALQLREEENLARQNARQAVADQQNKQLFDLKLAEVDRANKERDALQQFSKGMLEPQAIGGILTDTITPEQVARMEFTPDELAQYNAAGGDISKLTGSTKNKAELQLKLSDLSDQIAVSPEYQETGYETARRVAGKLDTISPEIYEQLKAYQVADVTAQKERLAKQAEYSSQAKEIDAKIAELKTKQGAKADDIIGLGKEWGKKGTYTGGTAKLDTEKMLKYADMVKDTDSAEELQGMIKEVFTNPNIPENQKEGIAANLVLSSGAKLPQGLVDFGKLNVSVEDAQKATQEYLANLKGGKFTPPSSSEIAGIQGQIDLLEGQKAGLLTKAGLYDKDRIEAAKTALGSRINTLLGTDNASTGNVYAGNKAIQIVEAKEGPLTDEMKYVISNEGYSDKPYIDKAGRREVETVGVGQTGDYKDKTFKATYEDRLNILKKQVPQLDNLPPEVRKTLIDNHYRGEIGSNTIKLINEGKYAEAGDAFLKGRKDYNEDTPQQIKNRMDALVNSLKSVQPKQEPDIKQLFANVKDAKQEQKAVQDFSKLTELYKSLGGTGGNSGSAGPIDDLRITREAEAISKSTNTPVKEILDTIKSQVRQDALTNSRNEIISKRMFDTKINKLKNDPKVQEDYEKAWRAEAVKRGYIGTSARPFSIEEFIQKTYTEKLQYK